MVRLSYELSVMFDHNPIIEIGHGYELFKVGLRPPMLSCRGSAARSAVGILRPFYRCRSPSSVARSHFAKLASAT